MDPEKHQMKIGSFRCREQYGTKNTIGNFYTLRVLDDWLHEIPSSILQGPIECGWSGKLSSKSLSMTIANCLSVDA